MISLPVWVICKAVLARVFISPVRNVHAKVVCRYRPEKKLFTKWQLKPEQTVFKSCGKQAVY